MADAKHGDGTHVVPFVRALVKRGYDTVAADVPPSEVPILRALHGHENVTVDDAAEPGDVRVDSNAEVELARLRGKYSRKGDEDVVRFVYPNGHADLAAFGFVQGGPAAEQAQASVTVRKPKVK